MPQIKKSNAPVRVRAKKAPAPVSKNPKKKIIHSHVATWKALLVLFFLSGMAGAFIFNSYFSLESSANIEATNQFASAPQKQEVKSAEAKAVQAAVNAKGKKWIAGDTEISKLTPEERKNRLGFIDPKDAPTAEPMTFSETANDYLATVMPDTLDWKNYNGANYVTPVKNQANCGSCWAFGTTATLEAETNIMNNSTANLDLSEQVVPSCSGAGTCAGGYPSSASSFMQSTGVPSESFYPYIAQNGTCANAQEGWQTSAYKIKSFKSVAANLIDIKNALYTNGPVVTIFNVYSDFFYYRSGIYQYATGTYQGGHAVSIVGYDDANQCFIVKNSWGTGWGEAGYFRIGYSELSSIVRFASSNYAYTVEGNGSSTPAIPTSISVSAPNGAEQWMTGTNKTISWMYGGNPGNIKIELINTLDNSLSFISSNTPVTAGSYNWSIPVTQATGTYLIKLTSIASSSISDVSDAPFSIDSPVPTVITVKVPNSGEKYKINATLPIQWGFTGNTETNVNIDLVKGSTVVKSLGKYIAIGANGIGSLKWKINYRTAGTDYKIKVSGVKNNTIADQSDGTFSITK